MYIYISFLFSVIRLLVYSFMENSRKMFRYAKKYRKYSKQIAYYIHYFPLQLWIRSFNLHKHRAIKREPLNINLSAHEYTNVFLLHAKYTNNRIVLLF